MVQIALNNKSKEAKALLEYLKNLSFVKILDDDLSPEQIKKSHPSSEESPYNEKFVKKIKKIIKKDSFKELDPTKL